jgi:hypothetical protein
MDSVGELLQAAQDSTGLTDFGDDSFREGLERLVGSLQDEAELGDVGVYALREMLVGLLKNRLQIEDWYRRRPEIGDEVIERPLIGLGLPRTGSTALSFLLAQDPNARSLLLWQAQEPCPPPSTVSGVDPRIGRTEEGLALQKQVAPRMSALVPSAADGPMECQPLMGLDFKSQYFQAFAYMPSYSDWLFDADLTSTYLYERRVLKLLQWNAPARPWRLKCPSHLLYLDYLDVAFPDARFVMTHRDPTEVIASVADVYAEVAALIGGSIDPHYLGRFNIDQWSAGMQRAIAFRDNGNDHRFYDMDFRAVQADPIGEVRKLYAWLGEPVTPEFEAGMARWWHDNAESREHNVHPDPAVFGIEPDVVRPLFADYMARVTTWT